MITLEKILPNKNFGILTVGIVVIISITKRKSNDIADLGAQLASLRNNSIVPNDFIQVEELENNLTAEEINYVVYNRVAKCGSTTTYNLLARVRNCLFPLFELTNYKASLSLRLHILVLVLVDSNNANRQFRILF